MRKLWIRREKCAGVTIFFPSTNQALISSLPLSAFSSPSNNISCSPCGHEVEIHDELRPHNQKNVVSLTFTCTKLAVLFQVWVTVFRPTAKTLFEKFSSAFARLTSCVLTSTRCMPKFSCESHDTWFFKFQLPLLLHEQSNDDWNESLSEQFGCFLNKLFNSFLNSYFDNILF